MVAVHPDRPRLVHNFCSLPRFRKGAQITISTFGARYYFRSFIMGWQKTFTLDRRAKGCHLITDDVLSQIRPGLQDVQVGMLFLFVKHTSCALTINENWDPDVRRDMDMALDSVVPESLNWRHTDEGPDDSVSHTKSSLVGSTVSMPITNGALNLGTWQGIYLTEFRHLAHTRTVVATILIRVPILCVLLESFE
ncbi:hypothetical protein BDP27DRAFT_749323 [Rhodocollybia butyracea]|uniref:Uncharacterized protein n=1 Tax=Rhodocollybia butyracea TaxID=206335 RepID=A0A9P5PW85_9AGAR|nr:hypothetical protein BDP27DRAFT_749323 [Rhodocollybia butyracea]